MNPPTFKEQIVVMDVLFNNLTAHLEQMLHLAPDHEALRALLDRRPSSGPG